jgi:hypothetical protein
MTIEIGRNLMSTLNVLIITIGVAVSINTFIKFYF